MGCRKEDYQLLLNNIVRLLKTNCELAIVLMKSQSITVNEIPFEGIVEDVINGKFIINGLSINRYNDNNISVRGFDQFDGKNFDKSVGHIYNVCNNWNKTYSIHNFKYRMTNYLYQNLKNAMDDRIK